MKTYYIFLSLLIICFVNVGKCQPVNFPPYIIQDKTFNLHEDSKTYETVIPIVSPDDPTKEVTVTENASVIYKSDESVTLKDGFWAKGFDDGNFQAFINDPGYDVLIFHPTETPGEVEKYDKFEIGVSLPVAINDQINTFLDDVDGYLSSINPYDEDQIDMIAVFTHIQSKTQETRFGFYYRNYRPDPRPPDTQITWVEDKPIYNGRIYNWRVRFTPELVGDWTCSITISSPYFSTIEINNLTFTCIPSNRKDYLSIGNNGKHLWHEDSQEYEFLSGMNIMFVSGGGRPLFRPESVNLMESRIDSLVQYRSNYIGTAMIAIWDWSASGSGYRPICSYGIEWERLGVYDKFRTNGGEIIDNRQVNAWLLDKRFEKCEANGVYQKFALLTHDAFNNAWGDQWLTNPYHTMLGGYATAVDFFDEESARSQFKKYLRYVIARWGYSTSIAYYFLLYEADGIYPQGNSMNAATKDWFHIMSNYVKQIDENHMVSAAYAAMPENNNLFSDSDDADIVLQHNYKKNHFQNKSRLDNMADDDNFFYGRPSGYSEIGTQNFDGYPIIESCYVEPFHQTIWATAFMRNFGTLHWNTDQLQSKLGHRQFRTLYEFFDDINLADVYSYEYDWSSESADCDAILPNSDNRNYEIFYVRSHLNQYVGCYGWISNLSYYWYNLYGGECAGGPPSDDDACDDPHFSDKGLEITGLTIGKSYRVDYYYTGKSNPNPDYDWKLLYNMSEDIDPIPNDGKCHIYPKDALKEAYDNGYYSDAACKIFPVETRSINYFTYDTLDCYLDTIFSSGYYKDDYDTLLDYHWHFGNGQESDEVWPAIHYNIAGNYKLTLYVSDDNTLLDSIVCYMTVLDCNIKGDDMRNKEVGVENNSVKTFEFENDKENCRILFYPNPSNGTLYVNVECGSTLKPFQISVFNLYGVEVFTLTNISEKTRMIDLSLLPKGIYYLKVNYNSNIKTNKIIFK